LIGVKLKAIKSFYLVVLSPQNRNYSYERKSDMMHYDLQIVVLFWGGSQTKINGNAAAGEIHLKFARSNNRFGYILIFIEAIEF
jgi:hypothetical protein